MVSKTTNAIYIYYILLLLCEIHLFSVISFRQPIFVCPCTSLLILIPLIYSRRIHELRNVLLFARDLFFTAGCTFTFLFILSIVVRIHTAVWHLYHYNGANSSHAQIFCVWLPNLERLAKTINFLNARFTIPICAFLYSSYCIHSAVKTVYIHVYTCP